MSVSEEILLQLKWVHMPFVLIKMKLISKSKKSKRIMGLKVHHDDFKVAECVSLCEIVDIGSLAVHF